MSWSRCEDVRSHGDVFGKTRSSLKGIYTPATHRVSASLFSKELREQGIAIAINTSRTPDSNEIPMNIIYVLTPLIVSITEASKLDSHS